ncbi:MAG TPA: hypothetical protein ENI23_07150 [bacterium]|nr:hypothetical protein [bacterium]
MGKLQNNNIAWLDQNIENLNKLGGKGANLVRLKTLLGKKIPNGFVITTDIFDQSAPELKQAVENKDVNDYSKELLSKLSSPFDNKNLSVELENSFNKLIKETGEVSVRSSATVEDSEKASFAGQFESYLSIDNLEDFKKTVYDVYASTFKPQVLLYSKVFKINPKDIKMAVVVQSMIDADKAGVLFTKDPTGQSDNLIINAARGLGTEVVDGTGETEKIVVNTTGSVVQKSQNSMLSDKETRELKDISIQIKKDFGSEQDIEWAIKDGKLYILQTRPIT